MVTVLRNEGVPTALHREVHDRRDRASACTIRSQADQLQLRTHMSDDSEAGPHLVGKS
jgi:hypothetical protein